MSSAHGLKGTKLTLSTMFAFLFSWTDANWLAPFTFAYRVAEIQVAAKEDQDVPIHADACIFCEYLLVVR